MLLAEPRLAVRGQVEWAPWLILWSFASGGSVTGGATIVGGSVYWGSGYCGTACLGSAPVTNNNKVWAFGLAGRG